MKKMMPIGISDFKEVIEDNYYYIDKTLLIKEILDNRAKVTLIPRPRRFGKTLNMSMLSYFFEKPLDDKNRGYLFKNLKITNHKDTMKDQGKYPVIFLSLKFTSPSTWQGCFEAIKKIIGREFKRHSYLLQSSSLLKFEKKEFQKIMEGTADQPTYEMSLFQLNFYLKDYYNQAPVILIDEYDVPIHAGYLNGYYNEVTSFIKSFFGNGMKDNIDLNFAIITGALRVAKESIFTGMNNLKVCTFASNFYTDKFGLLEDEVIEILKYYKLEENLDEVRRWYNGYTSGKFKVYNPWSIINLVDCKGELKPYWVNTSTNDIIKDLIHRRARNAKDTLVEDEIARLLNGESIKRELREDIIYSDIKKDPIIVWNFLFFSGYLTFKNKKQAANSRWYVDLYIPNQEVAFFFESTITSWLYDGEEIHSDMLQALVDGNVDKFRKLFTRFVLTSFGHFDVASAEPEKFYHAFVLGILASLLTTHVVTSNRESALGRYDVAIVPKDKTQCAIIIEFKRTESKSVKVLEKKAQEALQQIEDRQYVQEILASGISKVIKLGIGFSGKNVIVCDTLK